MLRAWLPSTCAGTCPHYRGRLGSPPAGAMTSTAPPGSSRRSPASDQRGGAVDRAPVGGPGGGRHCGPRASPNRHRCCHPRHRCHPGLAAGLPMVDPHAAARPSRPSALARLVPPLLIGYLGNAVLPARLGEPMRAVIVSRRERVDMAESLGSVLVERVVDVAMLAPWPSWPASWSAAPAWTVQLDSGWPAAVGHRRSCSLITIGLSLSSDSSTDRTSCGAGSAEVVAPVRGDAGRPIAAARAPDGGRHQRRGMAPRRDSFWLAAVPSASTELRRAPRSSPG